MLIYVWIYTHTKFELPPTAAWEMSNFFYMTKFQEYFWFQYTQFKYGWEAEEAARNMNESVLKNYKYNRPKQNKQ